MAKYTPELLVLEMQSAYDPQLSPDGEWVVYGVSGVVVETKKRTSNLWISRRDGSDARQLTYAGHGSWAARWSPNGEFIVFASERGDGVSLYQLPLSGGDPKKLATHRLGVAPVEFSPDGTKIAYSAIVDPANPEGTPPEMPPVKVATREDYKTDTRGFLNDIRGQVFVYDFATGEESQLTSGKQERLHPRWSPDGTKLAYHAPINQFMWSKLEVLDIASGETKQYLPGTGTVGVWTWLPDGETLLVGHDQQWQESQDLYLLHLGSGETTQITHDLQPLLAWAGSAAAPPAQPVLLDGGAALFAAESKGRNGLFAVDIETGDVVERGLGISEDSGFSVDAAGRYVARVRNQFDATGEVVIYDLQTGGANQITNLNTAFLSENPPSQYETFTLDRDGLTIEGWILKPADFDPAKKYPLILDIHGGPQWWYGYDFDKLKQLFASNDFIVVYANPRGSGSYGGAFTRASKFDWGGGDYLDLMAAVDYAESLPYVDAGRVGVYGYSYGGFMTSWIIGHTHRFEAAVIGAPVADLVSFWGTSDIGTAWGSIIADGSPWETPEYYRTHSPITYIHTATTPTLIVQAEGDIRCPIGQGEQVFATLNKIGVEAEFARYPGKDHLFIWAGEPVYILDYYERLLGWFKKHLGEAA